MKWQPIETAPKDGTWIFLWRGECDLGVWSPMILARYQDFGGSVVWAWPDGPYDAWADAERCNQAVERGDCYFVEVGREFTHWTPLPEPPQ